jgi:hypothetical protein
MNIAVTWDEGYASFHGNSFDGNKDSVDYCVR